MQACLGITVNSGKLAVFLALFAALSYAGPVECYGELKTNGNKLVGSKTYENPVQVRSVSLGWSNSTWESARFFTETTVNAMVDNWKAEIIRAPLGTGGTGYISQKEANKTRITTVVDAAIQKGVYAIIDWHSHGAHLAAEQQEAITFFGEMAQIYGGLDNVIFEIYNEPNCSNGGNNCNNSNDKTNWEQIKSYAEAVIPAIREHSDNLIIVGTPNWCQYVNNAVSSPINDPNVAYVFHFYAHSHALNSFRSRLTTTLNANLPIFVSEYGTTDAGGGQYSATGTNNYNTHNAERADAWHSFMDSTKISSVAWNVNDKREGSAFFGIDPFRQFDMNTASNWTSASQMTPSGQYIYNKLNSYHNAGLPWQACNFTSVKNSASVTSSFDIKKADKLEIFNLQGQMVATQIGNLPKGIYVVKAAFGSENRILRFAVR